MIFKSLISFLLMIAPAAVAAQSVTTRKRAGGGRFWRTTWPYGFLEIAVTGSGLAERDQDRTRPALAHTRIERAESEAAAARASSGISYQIFFFTTPPSTAQRQRRELFCTLSLLFCTAGWKVGSRVAGLCWWTLDASEQARRAASTPRGMHVRAVGAFHRDRGW